MKLVKDRGIVLISVFFLLLGAYNIIYAKILLTALNEVSCFGMDCMTLGFLRMMAWVLGAIGVCYIITAIVIRLHEVGCYLAIVASCFNILLMVAYLTKLSVMPIWMTFILPVRIILTQSISYSPWQTRDFLSIMGSSLEILIILLNIGVIAYLFKYLGKEVWGPADREPELGGLDKEEIEE